MQLFSDEKIVTQSNDKTVTLTTHRIYQEKKGMSSGSTKSIMLEHVTSCESNNRKYWIWIIVAALGGLGVLMGSMYRSPQEESTGIVIPSLCAVVLGITLFMGTKQASIKISSPSAVILINVNRMTREKINEFIDLIEQTKHARISSLGAKGAIQ